MEISKDDMLKLKYLLTARKIPGKIVREGKTHGFKSSLQPAYEWAKKKGLLEKLVVEDGFVREKKG